MNKKIIILIIVIIIALSAGVYFFINNRKDNNGCFVNKGYSWCKYQDKCMKKTENCEITQGWVLEEAKKVIGMDLNIMPNEFIKWNAKGEKLAFSAKGIYFLDLLKAEKIIKGFEDWDKFLKESGFSADSDNPMITSDKENTIKYISGKIVCQLKRIDNSDNSSSLGLYCGNMDDKLCDFNSDCGKECTADSECRLIADGCAAKTVCRNKKYSFFNDCLNPTSDVSKLNMDINICGCVNNQCGLKVSK